MEEKKDISCEDTPNAPECRLDCEEKPDAEGCNVDCELTPEAPECVPNCDEKPEAPACLPNCEENPDAEGCRVDCTENPEANECLPNCEDTPYAEGCPIDCERTPERQECLPDCIADPYDVRCPVDCERTAERQECLPDCIADPYDVRCPIDCELTPERQECLPNCELTPNAPGCEPVCGEGLTPCGSACVYLTQDTDNCGACGNICANRNTCEESACIPPPRDLWIYDLPVNHSFSLSFSDPIDVEGHDWYEFSCESTGVWPDENIFGQNTYRTVRGELDGEKFLLKINGGLYYNDTCTLTFFADKIFLTDTPGARAFSENVHVFVTVEPALYYESFETDWVANSAPAGWTTFRNHTGTPIEPLIHLTHAWTHLPDIGHPRNTVATSTSWFEPQTPGDEWMFSPEISLPPNEDCRLQWRARNPAGASLNGYEVRISTNGATISAGLQNAPVFAILAEENPWQTRTVPLTAWRGADIRVAFRNNSVSKYMLDIDDVVVLCD